VYTTRFGIASINSTGIVIVTQARRARILATRNRITVINGAFIVIIAVYRRIDTTVHRITVISRTFIQITTIDRFGYTA